MALQVRADSICSHIAFIKRLSLALALFMPALPFHGQIIGPVSQPVQATTSSDSSSYLGAVALNRPSGSSVMEIARADLPDAPIPEGQEQDQSRYPLIPPSLGNRVRLTPGQKFGIYIHKTYGPPAVILPLFAAGIQLANPKDNYPREWKDGGGAYGRNYGLLMGTWASKQTAQVLTDIALHEDPRYLRSTSTSIFGRTTHAIAFTFVDKSDSGRNMPAMGNFTSAAAGGFAGKGILPDGYNDMTHTGQHMTISFGSIAVGNILTEFEPEWGPLAQKLRVPKLLPPWWTPRH